MNDSRKLYHTFALSTLCLTAIFLIVRTTVLFFAFDGDVGYHSPGPLPTLLYIVMALFLLSTAAYALAAKRAAKLQSSAVAPDLDSAHLSVRLCSVLTAAVFAFAGLWESLAKQPADTAALVRVVGAALAIVYFAVPKKSKTFMLGLGPLAYFVFVLVTEYFDWTVPMNSPLKVMQQIAAVCAMLFLCAEMIQLAGKTRPLRLTVCAALTAFFGLSNGVSLIFALLIGDTVQTDYAVHALPCLAVGVYALIRLLQNREVPLPAPVKEAEAEQAPDTSEVPAPSQDLSTTNDEEN